MEIRVPYRTERAELLVAQASRGDYYEGFVWDDSLEDVLDGVSYKNHHIETAVNNNYYPELSDKNEGKLWALLQKQLSHGHHGVFEHPQITFGIEGISRVTMAQITRHRHLTFDIQSMRYADFSEKEPLTPRSLEDENHATRSGSVDIEYRDTLKKRYETTVDDLTKFYESMVDQGVPKEDARYILPLGTTVNMTVSGNARAMMHVLNIRMKADVQWETRELAEGMYEHLSEWMPYLTDWYDENGPLKLSP